MIRSIKYFLLISLLISITIAAAINGIGNYLLDEQVIEPYLDEQLIRTASLIEVLYQSSNTNENVRTRIIHYLGSEPASTDRKFLFQIWDKNGKILLHSYYSPNLSLQNAPNGFSDQVIEKNDWRIYSHTSQKLNVKIIVAEVYNLRRELGDDIAQSNATILLITYPVFGLLVLLIINFALRSVTRITSEISHRASTYLEPVAPTNVPVEVQPLIGALNELLSRLKLAFERNKRFSSDAAHELRTPLAALKTHVQVALKAKTDLERNKALQNVLESVDRSSHVVDQLLTLSRLGEETSLSDIKPIDLHKIATEMIAYLAPQALEKKIEIELGPRPSSPIILGNDTAIGILIRNVVDNAIRYTPAQGEVKVEILETNKQVILRTTDTGIGIPEELRDRVFERFFRVLGTNVPGSGLGLAIVNQIAKLHHAEILLSTPPNKIGLQFEVVFPKYHQ